MTFNVIKNVTNLIFQIKQRIKMIRIEGILLF